MKNEKGLFESEGKGKGIVLKYWKELKWSEERGKKTRGRHEQECVYSMLASLYLIPRPCKLKPSTKQTPIQSSPTYYQPINN